VDYIKIGFFPGGDWQGCLFKLKPLSQGNQMIAVMFADTQPDFSAIKAIKEAGFIGVMLDTMDKSQGSLTQVMSLDKIKIFVSLAKQSQLLCGLAGSLKVEDIPVLLELKADYLGFRGALCEKQERTAKLSLDAIHILLQSFMLSAKTRRIKWLSLD
jgi:dihydroneopterin aldolase